MDRSALGRADTSPARRQTSTCSGSGQGSSRLHDARQRCPAAAGGPGHSALKPYLRYLVAQTAHSGPASAPPGAEPGENGDARRQAAMAVTGQASYSTHERGCARMDWASRKATPSEIRAKANDALRRIEPGEPVKPLYLRVKEIFDRTQEPLPEVETNLARQARGSRTSHPRGERERLARTTPKTEFDRPDHSGAGSRRDRSPGRP